MRKGWKYMTVGADAPLKCTICGVTIPIEELSIFGDTAYFPSDVPDEEYAMLRERWHVDPYSDLIVCGMCEWAGKPWSPPPPPPPPQNANGSDHQQQ
jgi:hypothetical protein